MKNLMIFLINYIMNMKKKFIKNARKPKDKIKQC